MSAPRSRVAFAVLALCVACGPSSDPGSGSKTLHVVARIFTDGTADGTRARVEVRERAVAGPIVSDATVSVRGEHVSTATGLAFDAGVYDGAIAWDGWFEVKVVRGDKDELHGAIDAPGVTTIVRPAAGSTFSKAGAAQLGLEWTDSLRKRATRANVTFAQAAISSELTDDPLRVSVASSRLAVTSGETIAVERFNEITLVGGTEGSLLTATSTASVQLAITE